MQFSGNCDSYQGRGPKRGSRDARNAYTNKCYYGCRAWKGAICYTKHYLQAVFESQFIQLTVLKQGSVYNWTVANVQPFGLIGLCTADWWSLFWWFSWLRCWTYIPWGPGRACYCHVILQTHGHCVCGERGVELGGKERDSTKQCQLSTKDGEAQGYIIIVLLCKTMHWGTTLKNLLSLALPQMPGSLTCVFSYPKGMDVFLAWLWSRISRVDSHYWA